MDAKQIYESFKNLSRITTEDNAFNILSLPDSHHKLGVSGEGYPMSFVKTSTEKPDVHDLHLDIFTVEYNQKCTLKEEGQSVSSDIYSILTLQNCDEPLQRYFIEISLLILEKLRDVPSRRELSIQIDDLVAIFTALREKGKKTVQGLWAELLVIEKSLHPEVLINAWHSAPKAKYDFTLGYDKLEVKSTSGDERVHHFTIDQLLPSEHSHLLIASVFVRESGAGLGGLCIKDLYDSICKRVTNIDSRLKIQKVMGETIGNDYSKLDSEFFDYATASDTLAYYDAENIPHIDKAHVPAPISKVEFDCNIGGVLDIKSDPAAKDYSKYPLYRSIF